MSVKGIGNFEIVGSEGAEELAAGCYVGACG